MRISCTCFDRLSRHAGRTPAGLGMLVGIWLALSGLMAVFGAETGSFYTRPAVFSTRPSDQSKYMQSIDRFGPVGIGIELHPPAFVMKVKNVEEGSPAAKTGKLKAGQIIETINGQKLHDIDPRIQLGKIITDAEATDGNVTLIIRDDEKAPRHKVTVSIPVLGAYSPTWPVNCPKSDKIVRSLAQWIKKDGFSDTVSLDGPKMLFLLSTGDESDLDVVRGWVKKTVEKNQHFGEKGLVYQWFVGWGGPPLAEYYLRTGDKSVLPLLKKIADSVKKTQYNDAWGGRGLAGHHMGIAGTQTLTFLLLAKQCGVDVDEVMLQRALRHFYRFAGRGVNPYPDIRPESTFTDNGRVGLLAFAMEAATALTPEGDLSVYASARDISAIKSFYSTSYMLHGHTGGGIGEVWRSASMGLMTEKEPHHYREFMNSRTWFYDLSRRYDGSFGILGGSKGYDTTKWGVAMGLTYTAPRKKLCIFGAPNSPFAKSYSLPKRPWGTVDDEAFLSLKPAAFKDGTVMNLDHETVAADTGVAIDRKTGNPNISNAELLRLVHHPEHRFREVAATAIYHLKRYDFIPQLLKDKDPRVRNAGVMAIKAPGRKHGKPVPGFPLDQMTPEIRASLFAMLNDPQESWFTVDKIMIILSQFDADELAPHLDRIVYFWDQDEWWLRESALKDLVPLALDKRYYKKVLPIIERNIPKLIRPSTISGLGIYATKLRDADPALQKAGREMLGRVYLAYPGNDVIPPGGLHPQSREWFLNSLAGSLSIIPGGLDTLYQVSQKRNPNVTLSHREMFLNSPNLDANSGKIKQALEKIIISDLIPAYVGRHYPSLKAFGDNTSGNWRDMDYLLKLYNRAGITTYSWQVNGPKRNEMEWYYFSFDPPEKWIKADDRMGRYREVTFPKGMATWFSPDYDPAKAGWKRGLAPFGSANGEKRIPAGTRGCTLSFCGCGEPVNTLWEKDVLLLRGTFTFPKLEKGNCYRLLHGGISHVGSGGGYRVYINGKLFIENKGGVDRRAGSVPIGKTITKEWWPEFNKGPVDLAVITFMKTHPRTKAYGGNIMISMERMKTPPLGDDMLIRSAAVVPMLCSEWQTLQDPKKSIVDPEEGKFRYDGTFTPNPTLLGSWVPVDEVATVDAFVPGERQAERFRPPFPVMTFKDKGRTNTVSRIWSGDMLMDLTKYQALRMTVKTIAGTDYLFMESGGFSARHPAGWETPLFVLKRK